MPGDENRLKDARIEVVLDTARAEKQAEAFEQEEGERSIPGSRPPQPGRERDKEDRRRPGKSRVGFGDLSAGAAIARVPGARAVMGALRTFAAAYALRTVSEVLPGMIDKKLSMLDADNIATRWALNLIKDVYKYIDNKFVQLESSMAAFGAGIGSATETARSQQLLLGQTDPRSIGVLAERAAAAASFQAFINAQKRISGASALGGAIVDIGEELKERYLAGVWR